MNCDLNLQKFCNTPTFRRRILPWSFIYSSALCDRILYPVATTMTEIVQDDTLAVFCIILITGYLTDLGRKV